MLLISLIERERDQINRLYLDFNQKYKNPKNHTYIIN